MIKEFRVEYVFQFGLEEGKVMAEQAGEFVVSDYTIFHFGYDESLNRILRWNLRDAYQEFIYNLPYEYEEDWDRSQVRFKFETGETIIVPCFPDEWDEFQDENNPPTIMVNMKEMNRLVLKWLDEMNVYGCRITAIHEICDDGSEKQIFSQNPVIKPMKKKGWSRREQFQMQAPPEAIPATLEFAKRYYGEVDVKEEETLDICLREGFKVWFQSPYNYSQGDWICEDRDGVFFKKKGKEDEGIFIDIFGPWLVVGDKITEVDDYNPEDYPGLEEFFEYYEAGQRG